MKKFIIFLAVCVVAFININPIIVYANEENNKNYEEELNKNVLDQIENLNFDDLDLYINQLSNDYNFFKNNSFSQTIKDIALGNYFSQYSNIFEAIINLFIGDVKSIIPLLILIVAISIIGSMLNNFKSDKIAGGINDIIHLVCYASIILILVGSISHVLDITYKTLQLMTKQMQVIFPIMLTLLTAVGGVVSVGIYKPVVEILTNGISFLFTHVLFPIFVLSFIFLVIGNLSKTVKLNKFNEFLISSFKWIVGFVFTMFSAFLTIQGISAGRFDNISVKATKFAVKSYIPIIGGYLSEGFDLILCSSVIIKNAVGVGGLFLIAIIIIKPIIQILVLKLCLQLLSAILEPINQSKIVDFTSGCAKILIYPIIMILSVAFMYFISTALIMITANIL